MTTYANHIRTMLLNREKGAFGSDFPGEEYVPATFRPREQTVPMTKIRTLLFGESPDRYMLNYRLHQMMQVLHSTEFDEYMTYHDDRITYLPVSQADWFENVFKTDITPNNGTLAVIGDPVPNEATGKLRFWWRVQVDSSTEVRVVELAPRKLVTTISNYTLTDGRSDNIQLPGNLMWCTFAGSPGDQWYVDSVARPTINMATIVVQLDGMIGDTEDTDLFGATPVEPYKTFRNLWRQHDKYAYRLAGLMLALAFRTSAAAEA